MNKNTIILTIASIVILFGLIAYGSMQMKKQPTVYEPYPTQPDTTMPQDSFDAETDREVVTPSRPTPAQPPVQDTNEGGMVACTMEAKMCPDGSYVGRTGPRCEFTACPGN